MGTSRNRLTARPGGATAAAVAALLALTLVAAGSPATPAVVAQEPEPAPSVEADSPVVEVDRAYRLTLQVPGTPESAFDAWTVADRFVEWFPDWAEMTVAEGETYRMGWEGHDGVWEGTYREIDEPGTLVFTWAPPESVYPEGAYPTTVRLTFEEAEEGTRIVMEHSGFRASGHMEPVLEAWRSYLFNLRAYLFQVAASGDESPGR